LRHLSAVRLRGCKEAGASQEKLSEAAAIAMTIQATRIRNTFGNMAQAMTGPSSGAGVQATTPAAQPGRD